MSYFGQLQRFDPVSGHVPDKPFSYLPVIARRARVLLTSRTSAQIDSVAKAIDFAIDCYFDELKQDEIQRLRDGLESVLSTPRRYKREPPELDRVYANAQDAWERFFEWDGGTIANGRWHFRESMEGELDIPNSENTTEIQALKECIDAWDDIGGEGFPDGKPEELFAALSLWMLADAVHWMDPNRDPKSMAFENALDGLSIIVNGQQVAKPGTCPFAFSQAADCMSLAMEAVCFAEHLHEVDKLNCERSQKDVAKQQEERKRRSMLGEKLNIARHQKTNEAKAKATEEWGKDTAKFPSAEKAGLHFANWLETQGFTFEPRTVTSWIRSYAKKIGVRFR